MSLDLNENWQRAAVPLTDLEHLALSLSYTPTDSRVPKTMRALVAETQRLRAQVAAAVEAEREACARVVATHATNLPQRQWADDECVAAWTRCMDAIRARGPSSALADALRQAKARGMREAAEIVRCGCVHAEQVADIADKHGANSAMRWRACSEANCGALEAAVILAAADAKEKGDG